MAFSAYIVYLVSFLLHLTARVPLLGKIRFDMILTGIVIVLALMERAPKETATATAPREKLDSGVDKILYVLIGYIVLTLPFVAYPGSILRNNFLTFLKCTLFFFFTAALIDSRKKLKILVNVFLGCQVLRVIEPLYLNITKGYWGSETYVGAGEMASRLAGGPFDVINSNGLAFVILTVLPLLHFLTEGSFKNRMVYLALLPAMMMALVKSLSRSGMLGFLIVYGFIFLRSKRKFLLLSVAVVAGILTVANMSDVQRDRYLSLVSSSSKQSGTASGRIEGLEADFKVAMMRPVFGFGLGTSAEAKFHTLGHAQLAHNLYLEVAQELGLVGLAIYLVFLKRIIGNFTVVKKRLRESAIKDEYILRLVSGLEVWMLMSLLFSLASYGLSDWSWYFFAGISLALVRVAEQGIAPGVLPVAEAPRRPTINSR